MSEAPELCFYVLRCSCIRAPPSQGNRGGKEGGPVRTRAHQKGNDQRQQTSGRQPPPPPGAQASHNPPRGETPRKEPQQGYNPREAIPTASWGTSATPAVQPKPRSAQAHTQKRANCISWLFARQTTGITKPVDVHAITDI